MNISPERLDELVRKCLRIGKRYFPAPLYGIYDRDDAESDFMYGVVVLGLKKPWWKAGDPTKFLVNNGLWTVRRRRYRVFSRRMQVLCRCGRRLKMNNHTGSFQRPCHGTMADRIVRARELPLGTTTDLTSFEEVLQAIKIGTRESRLSVPFHQLVQGGELNFGTR